MSSASRADYRTSGRVPVCVLWDSGPLGFYRLMVIPEESGPLPDRVTFASIGSLPPAYAECGPEVRLLIREPMPPFVERDLPVDAMERVRAVTLYRRVVGYGQNKWHVYTPQGSDLLALLQADVVGFSRVGVWEEPW